MLTETVKTGWEKTCDRQSEIGSIPHRRVGLKAVAVTLSLGLKMKPSSIWRRGKLVGLAKSPISDAYEKLEIKACESRGKKRTFRTPQ